MYICAVYYAFVRSVAAVTAAYIFSTEIVFKTSCLNVFCMPLTTRSLIGHIVVVITVVVKQNNFFGLQQ